MINVSSHITEEQIAAMIDEIKRTKTNTGFLTTILPRNHGVYKDRGIAQVNRIRGYAIASFETIGVPPQAIPYICEELDNGHSPYVVAACAIAIRGIEKPGTDLGDFLSRALLRFSHKDEPISFSSYKPTWPLQDYTTASLEILKTLEWLGAHAVSALSSLENYAREDGVPRSLENKRQALQTIEAIKNSNEKINERDCCSFTGTRNINTKTDHKDILDALLQDQNGSCVRFRDFFEDSISVVAFFYTRCDNPYKCSATINKLSQLQKALTENKIEKINIAAITYDGAYDTAEQIKQYTYNRGLQHNERCKAFRLENQHDQALKNYFELAVNYNNSIVNHHSIELFILNKEGKVINTFSGLELNIEKILNAVRTAQKRSSGILYKITTLSSNTIFPFLLLFFPKCPVCWAGYLSLFGISGISWLEYNKNFFWVLVLFIAINLFFMWRHAKKTNLYFPFALAIFSYILFFLVLKFGVAEPWKWIPIVLIAISSLLSILKFSPVKLSPYIR